MNKKKALCIGIDKYIVTGKHLEGCKNDALLWHSLLKDLFNFEVEPPILDADATKANIENKVKEFLKRTKDLYG